MELPSNLTAWTGMDAVTHAIEALLVPPGDSGEYTVYDADEGKRRTHSFLPGG